MIKGPEPHLYNTSNHQAAVAVAKSWWAIDGKLSYPPASMYHFLIYTIGSHGQHNGGVLYATRLFSSDRWESGVSEGFAELGKMVLANAKAIYNTVPSHACIAGQTANQKPPCGVALDSRDAKRVFLHALMPPTGRHLQMAKPTNGVTFSQSTLLSGEAV